MEYKELNDNELLSYVKESSEDASDMIYTKYKPLIVKIARKLYKYKENSGFELNDLVQEGMIGLSRAIDTFDNAKEASFYTYATRCIERSQVSLLVSSRRQKNRPLNESVPFEVLDDDKEEMKYVEVFLADNSYNPESVLTNTESTSEFMEKLGDTLTPFEYEVFELKVAGFGYKEISDILEKDKKQIDNAIQRIKTKMKDLLKNN